MKETEWLLGVLQKMSEFLANHGELLVAVMALLLSIWSFIKASKAQKLQDKLNELELRIKQNEIAKIEKEKEEAALSHVEGRVVCLGNNQYRLRVWNSGKSPARNVVARIEGGVGIDIVDTEKMPFDELLPQKKFELFLIVIPGAVSKFRIVTEWEDAVGEKQSFSQMGDL